MTKIVEAQPIPEEVYEKLVIIADKNTETYNLLKLCEELTELQERLLKFHLKVPDKKPSKTEIAEEVGDVLIRTAMYVSQDEEMMDLVEKRVEIKADKLWKFFQLGMYKNGI